MTDSNRRALLQTAAALALAQLAPETAKASEQAPGKAGEFDFLAGQWKIVHKRLKAPGQWDEFAGEATCWSILGGTASIEELRIPARDFAGMGIRLLEPKRRVWTDYWVNARENIIVAPGMTGSFSDGVGTFVAEDMDGERPIKVRGVWDRVTARSCRWHQATSRDGGRTWEGNWFMDWTRA